MNGEAKPGWRTTEFWLSTAAVIGGVLMASGIFECPPSLECPAWIVMGAKLLGIGISVLAALGYTKARGFVKAETARSVAVAPLLKGQAVTRDPSVTQPPHKPPLG